MRKAANSRPLPAGPAASATKKLSNGLHYRVAPPAPALAPLVEHYQLLTTDAAVADRPIWLLPDGRVDVLFVQTPTQPFRAVLLGLGTRAEAVTLEAGTVLGGVGLRLPAAEYLLRARVADIRDGARVLPAGFWGLTPPVVADFDQLCAHLNDRLPALARPVADPRKRQLFELLYATDGALPVHELAARAGWSSRQINRYFQAYFGVSLKTYCAILRFRAAFPQLRAGRLFPEQAFADQAHFIREVRRFAGVRPGELARNEDGRFIQFSV